MRALLPCLFLLSACATAPEPTQQRTTMAQNQAEQLASGECGLFGWTADARRAYVFFANAEGATLALDGPETALTAQSKFPALEYIDADGRPVSLSLGRGEPLAGGTRYPSARLATKTEDGWDKIVPVAIVQSCQA